MILRLLAKAIGVLNQNHVFFFFTNASFLDVMVDVHVYIKYRVDWQRNDYIVTYYIPYYKDTVYKDQWIQRTFQLLFLSILAQIYSISE